jgi:protein O-GlcNAc transferase
MTNQFDSKGGEQNVGQGDKAIGKQENVTQHVSGGGNIFSATGNVAVTYGMSPEDAGKLARELLAPLQGELAAKNEQIKALTEAIAALSKTGAPTASINAALQALEQGDTAKAQAVFAEVLKTKEAEGRQANKEAAAAARHMGALAYLHDTNGALAAYRKAVELDPDNADGWNQLAALFLRTGELEQAEAAWRKSLALEEALGRKEGMAQDYGNLGNVYRTRGELDKAEEMHRKSLALEEALGRKEGMAQDYGNLGLVAYTRGDLDKAEEMYRKSLAISEALGLKEATANQYGNLGLVHWTRGDLDKAEEMHRKALELDQALSSKEGMAQDYGNLGLVHEQRGDLAQAEAAWKKSLRLFQEMGHPNAKKVQQLLDDLAR